MRNWKYPAIAFNLAFILAPASVTVFQSAAPRLAWSMLGISVLLLLTPMLLLRRWGSYFLLMLPVALSGIAYQLYLNSYGGLINGGEVLIVLLTATWDEIWGFIKVYRSLGYCAALALGVLMYVALSIKLWSVRLDYRPWLARRRVLAAIGLSIGLPFAAVFVQPSTLNKTKMVVEMGIWTHPLGTLQFIATAVPEATQMVGLVASKTPYKVSSPPPQDAPIYLLIIGESARYDAFHLNGYCRQTSPELEKRELISLSHAVATGNLTRYVVPMLMTGIAPESYLPSAIHGNLLDLFKEAGYSTTWMINQDPNVSAVFGPKADNFFFPMDKDWTPYGRRILDGILLPRLASTLRDIHGASFIAMHTSGSHWDYSLRYPKEQLRPEDIHLRVNLHNEDQIRASYDKSIAYTDWFLAQAIELLAATNRKAVLIYASDHGENFLSSDVIDGHGLPRFAEGDAHIPVFIWASPAYQRAEGDKWKKLVSNQNSMFTSDNVFHTLSDMARLDFPELDRRRSLVSDQYSPKALPQIMTVQGLQPLTNCKNCGFLLGTSTPPGEHKRASYCPRA
ncbi:MAG: phosphoethanolamine transferase [Pseudomonadota bacterium]